MALAWALGMWITGAAQGATYNLGLLTDGGIDGSIRFNSIRVSDEFAFGVGAQGTGGGAHYSVEFKVVPEPNHPLSDVLVTLLGSDRNVLFSVSSSSFNGILGSGSYYANVVGTAVGAVPGEYRFRITSNLSAVPLPPAAWLLAAGLAGLVGIARRKNSPAGGRTAAE